MSDLQSKYQKLAVEFSKIRAQIPVLKKAVLDEQAAGEELKETIKNRDQSIRKYEQEADSLTFRNQQLESRVEILQKELQEAYHGNHGKKQKKTSLASTISTTPVEVIDEELKLKIEENARLHRQVADLDEEHHKDLVSLEKKLKETEEGLMKCQSNLDECKSNHRQQLEKFMEEKGKLEVKIRSQEDDVTSSVHKANELEKQLTTIQENLTKELENANRIIQQKLTFNDSIDEAFNELNVKCQSIQNHTKFRDLTLATSEILDDFMSSFESFFGHLEVKVNYLSSNPDFSNSAHDYKQFLNKLSESMKFIHPIRSFLNTLKEPSNDESTFTLVSPDLLKTFSRSLEDFVDYTKQIISCELQSLETESNQPSCTSAFRGKMSDLQRSFVSFASSLSNVQEVATALLCNETSNENERQKIIMQLSQATMNWVESAKDLSRTYNTKSSIERQLPTCSTSAKIAEERICDSIVELSNQISKLSTYLSASHRSILDVLESIFNTEHPCTSMLRKRAVQYRELVIRSPSESVPYLVALQNKKTIISFAENKDDLTKQVLDLQEKLNKAEQDKEHWSLEAQLMTMKYKKEIEKFNALVSNSELSSSHTICSRAGDLVASGVNLQSELGKVEVVREETENGDDADWTLTREKIVSEHYERRINELVSNLQMADSKALHFNSECRSLHKQLSSCLKERDRLQSELQSINQGLAKLRDELQTTSRSYEGQLSVMSEHLADMNEKLTRQKDEIDGLKFQLQQQNQSSRPSLLKRGKF